MHIVHYTTVDRIATTPAGYFDLLRICCTTCSYTVMLQLTRLRQPQRVARSLCGSGAFFQRTQTADCRLRFVRMRLLIRCLCRSREASVWAGLQACRGLCRGAESAKRPFISQLKKLSRSVIHLHGKKGKGSPYSITERRVLELIPVLGSQPAGDVSHQPGDRLPLLSARPAVTPTTLKRAATDFAAW